MLGLIGIAVILIMVFGGYVLAGGKMGIILKALPFELIMIGGAAVGGCDELYALERAGQLDPMLGL